MSAMLSFDPYEFLRENPKAVRRAADWTAELSWGLREYLVSVYPALRGRLCPVFGDATSPTRHCGTATRVAIGDAGFEVVYVGGATVWHDNGVVGRTGQPAVKYDDGYEEWRVGGRLDRRGGPAVVWRDNRLFYTDGMFNGGVLATAYTARVVTREHDTPRHIHVFDDGFVVV